MQYSKVLFFKFSFKAQLDKKVIIFKIISQSKFETYYILDPSEKTFNTITYIASDKFWSIIKLFSTLLE